MSKIKLDLHDIYNQGNLIDKTIKNTIYHAIDNNIKSIEIIYGKGSGQLKKRVIRLLQKPELKNLYHRFDKDNKNFGRLFIFFKT